jgi:hypothetical protein
MSGVEDNLKALNEKLEMMMNRLDYLEAILTESRKYPELAQLMGNLKVGTALYGEPLKLIQRLLGVRRYLDKTPESRDEVSRIILNALAMKGPMVRKRVRELLEEEAIEKGEGHEYRLRVYEK